MSIIERLRLTDRVAVVTGASSGLGMHAALGLAQAGANLVLVARRRERLETACTRIEEAGGQCVTVVGDVSDPATATRAAQAALERFGRIDVLLNSAGVGTAVPAISESPEEFRRVHEINLHGPYWMAQACGQGMRPGGSIINVSSILGLRSAGLPQAAYASSKAAVIAMTRDMAAQWSGRLGIRVNAIAPGFFDTEMTAQYPEGYLDAITKQVPAGRLGRPDEFVAVVLFLASDAASFITGVTLPVDGGMLA